MKKFLYIMPAVLVCMLYLLLTALAGGISGFQPIALVYIISPIAAGILLRKGKWWGGVPGMAMGALMIYGSMTAETTVTLALVVGIILSAYYAVMSLLCAADNKKK